MAFTQAQTLLRHLGITAELSRQYDRLASRALYLDTTLRARGDILTRNRLGQPGLWTHGISGDLPIVLVKVVEADDLALVRQVLQAQEYWRVKALAADVVILNEHATDYLDEVHQALSGLLDGGVWSTWRDRPGGIYLLRADALGADERVLIESAAAAVLSGDRGELSEQLDRPAAAVAPPRALASEAPDDPEPPETIAPPPLVMPNGVGGFTEDGREYVIALEGDVETPAPWCNILANPGFGSLVTSSGASFTWSGNSRENRLTPFANDPVSDVTAEAIYVRDDGPAPSGATSPRAPRRRLEDRWLVRHRAGLTTFERATAALAQRLEVFVATDAAVKTSVLTLTNRADRSRRLSLFAYNAWLLGPPRALWEQSVVTVARPGHRRHPGAQPLERRARRARGLCLVQRAGAIVHRRSYRVPGTARLRRSPGRPGPRRAVQPGRRRTRPVRRPPRGGDTGAGRDRAGGVPDRRGRVGRRRAGGHRRVTATRARPTRRWPACTPSGTNCWARFRSARPTTRSISW